MTNERLRTVPVREEAVAYVVRGNMTTSLEALSCECRRVQRLNLPELHDETV